MNDPYSVKNVQMHYSVEFWSATPLARQHLTGEWAKRCFGADSVEMAAARAAPLLEEACEAFQSLIELQRKVNPQYLKDKEIYTLPDIRAFAHRIVDRVLDNPPGEIHNELGGVMVAALCAAHGLGISLDECEKSEVTRILEKEKVLGPEYFAARKQKKVDAGVIL